MRRMGIVALAAVMMFAAGAVAFAVNSGYRVSVVLASATNLVEGGAVQINGFEAGRISGISVHDGKAVLTMDLDDDFAPLHDGAKVRVDWKAVLGERLLTVVDGPATNATIPDGGMLRGEMPVPMEFDQVLAALDQPTRDHLVSVVNKLDDTVRDHSNPIVLLLAAGAGIRPGRRGRLDGRPVSPGCHRHGQAGGSARASRRTPLGPRHGHRSGR